MQRTTITLDDDLMERQGLYYFLVSQQLSL